MIETILTFIITQATIWAPAITAIVGIVVFLIVKAKEVKDALKEFKDDSSNKDLHNDLNLAHYDNQCLREQLDEIIVQLSRIKNLPKENEENGKKK